jgi:hypothetical protein
MVERRRHLSWIARSQYLEAAVVRGRWQAGGGRRRRAGESRIEGARCIWSMSGNTTELGADAGTDTTIGDRPGFIVASALPNVL